jgi:hypothetical protein
MSACLYFNQSYHFGTFLHVKGSIYSFTLSFFSEPCKPFISILDVCTRTCIISYFYSIFFMLVILYMLRVCFIHWNLWRYMPLSDQFMSIALFSGTSWGFHYISRRHVCESNQSDISYDVCRTSVCLIDEDNFLYPEEKQKLMISHLCLYVSTYACTTKAFSSVWWSHGFLLLCKWGKKKYIKTTMIWRE